MEIRIAVPRLPAGLAANLLGLFGLVAFALAVGGLTGNWWWTALVGAVFAVGLSLIAQTHVAASASSVPVADAPAVPLRTVENGSGNLIQAAMARDFAFMRGEQVPASA